MRYKQKQKNIKKLEIFLKKIKSINSKKLSNGEKKY